jgi:hypothetical protein
MHYHLTTDSKAEAKEEGEGEAFEEVLQGMLRHKHLGIN